MDKYFARPEEVFVFMEECGSADFVMLEKALEVIEKAKGEMQSKIDKLKKELKEEKDKNTMLIGAYCSPASMVAKSEKEREMEKFKSEVEKYKQDVCDIKKEHDCQVAEMKSHIDSLKQKNDKLENTIKQIDSVLNSVFQVKHTDFENGLK